jgi:hypothetical protein
VLVSRSHLPDTGEKSLMSYSQHDSYCDDPTEETANPVKRKLSSILAFLLLLVGGTYLVQTTLAANISLNSGAPIEFGQGVTQTAACTGTTNLTITPNSSFVNASGGGAHYFSSVTVSNVPTSCYGDDFTIKGFNNTGNSPLAIFNTTSTSAVVWNDGGTFKLGVGSTGTTVAQSAGTFTVTFTSPVALSSTVFKVTVESGAHTNFYNIGQAGPGGGVVFYYLASGFPCGPTLAAVCRYLESSPANWGGGADPLRTWAQTSLQSTRVTNGIDTATATAIGAGYKNTVLIINQGNSDSSTAAAPLAQSYRGGGLSDWYLPSTDELFSLYTNRAIVGGFGLVYNYWPSSEHANPVNNGATSISFNTGTNAYNGKQNPNYVRPVRAFY